MAAAEAWQGASRLQRVRSLLADCNGELSLKEVEALLALLWEKKQAVEQLEAESNTRLLLDFLQASRHGLQEPENCPGSRSVLVLPLNEFLRTAFYKWHKACINIMFAHASFCPCLSSRGLQHSHYMKVKPLESF